jgi:hypothetical protein
MKLIDPIHDLVNTPIPEKLWHYTSVVGFHGIVTTKTIFATDTRYLNDREEFTHALKIANAVVEETEEFGPNGLPMRHFLRNAVDLAFVTGPVSHSQMQIYVAAFSAQEDQLSQWRGYSYGSSGVSLAFQLSAFRPSAAANRALCFAPCVYRLEEKKKLVRHALLHFLSESERIWDESRKTAEQYVGALPKGSDRLSSAMSHTVGSLLQIAALLKNESFYEEQEWRLVLAVLEDKANLGRSIGFRPRETTLVPYIKHAFSTDSEAQIPLVDVILGPGSHPHAAHAASFFLRSEGINNVSVRESSIPFRPF